MTLWRIYWGSLDRRLRIQTIIAILLSGATGVLEGAALLALIPVLEGASASAPTRVSQFWIAVVAWADLAPKMLLPVALAGFAIFGVFAALLRLVADGLLLKIRTGIEERARLIMTDALLNIDWSSYLALRQSDVTKALIVEGSQISAGANAFFGALGATLTAIFYFLCALLISVEMTLYTVIFGIFLASGYALAARQVRVHAEALSNLLSELGDKVADVFGNLKFFRATGSSQPAARKAAEIFRDFAKTSYRGQIYGPLMRVFFEASAILFVAIFLMWRVYWGGESAAVALVFLAVFYRLAPRLMSVQDGFLQAGSFVPWHTAWEYRLAYSKAHANPVSGSIAPAFKLKLAFENVRFGYPGNPDPVLRDISLNVRAGDCVALVGASGAGKTTLFDLATGLLAPQNGGLTIDGADLRDLDIEAWRSRLGLVLQDTPMFHTSILENIAWGDDNPDTLKAILCARKAHAWEFIEALPKGIDTIIGERGARLSGGERQRIALARALYRDPLVLILDEATSALDSHSEALVQETLESLKGKMTILIIAHRLKTVRMADSIVVLKDGVICEQGRWDELVARNGAFRALWEAQHIGSESNA